MTKQPALNGGGLMGAVVVEDQMDVEVLRHRPFDGIEELPEFNRAMASMAFSDHLTRFRIQRSE